MEYVNGGEVSLKKTFCTSDSSAVTGLHFKGRNFSRFPCFLLFLNCLLGLFFFFLQFFLTVLWKKRKVDLFKTMMHLSILEKLGYYFLKDNFMVG